MCRRLAERLGSVATLAITAKTTVMDVIAVVTGPAILGQCGIPGRLTVAVAATQAAMGAREREFSCLAVVELPESPAIRVVAALALFAQPALVDILGLVASQAHDRRISIRTACMALLAGHADMQADERELRQVVIKADVVVPTAFLVAGLALVPHRTGVCVVGGVATVAVPGHLLLLQDSRMAGVAVELLVGAAQPEFRLGMLFMVVVGHRPFLLAVAILAGRPEATGMPVGGGMTAAALLRQRCLEVAAPMAGVARKGRVLALEWVVGSPAVIKSGRLPVSRSVAGGAIQAPRPAVHVVRRMAVGTVHRRVLEPGIPMAGGAGHRCVSVGQREASLGVVELGRLEGGRLMALRTICPELAAVSIVLTMAVHALLGSLAEFLAFLVARVAGDAGMGAGQHEIGPLVVETPPVEADDVGLATLVLGMAGIALCLARRSTMETLTLPDVGGYRLVVVAGEAESRLTRSVGPVVALAAIVLQFGVRARELTRHEQLLQRVRKSVHSHQCHHHHRSPRKRRLHWVPRGNQYMCTAKT